MRDVALPLAATDPEVKVFVFTLISHTYTVHHTHPALAERFFKEFLIPGAEEAQQKMPPILHQLATVLEADVPVAPKSLTTALLRRKESHAGGVEQEEVNQSHYLAFMKPEHLHVAESVLAECTPKFATFQAEAVVAVADIAENPLEGTYVRCIV